MEEVVAVAKVWGVIMVGFFNPPVAAESNAPFIDVNYKDSAQCELVKADLLERFPTALIWCTETYKPDSAPKARKRVRTTKPATRTRTARRR